ncbi:hypothetical protein A7E78_11445 [Syntrophotalea acetylenivorans]|uniref:Uncharacterized protein n=1 Tax=Syntrophotalea acetylenivorans TaxID=1842532 RepID=A0A1L3GRX1_9BACT|nr:hypothetical protein [Syntrophotalea acetylenivorans]APG28408.1 hypothetical protein A7E78_11445 [Syntrophotalea acetylenivorans]
MSPSNKAHNHRYSARAWYRDLYRFFYLAGLWLFLLSQGPFCNAMAAAPTALEELASEQTSCFDHIWQMAHDHPWYLDSEGQQVAPEVARDWLIVRFREPGASPRQVKDFYSRYREAFDGLVETPDAAKSAAAYRLRQGLPYGLFDALLQRWRKDPQVHSIQPAWRIEQQLYVPLDKIEIKWKTTTGEQARHRLLEKAEALQGLVTKGPNTDIATIDPCRRLAWQTAALLGEDLYVASAVPLKRPLTPPVTIQFLLDRPGAMSGMPMPFNLEIHFAEGIKIDAATIANLNLNPSGIFHNLYEISYDHPLSAIDLSHSPIRITGTLRIYASGDYQLPALPVYFTDHRTDDASPVTIRTDFVSIRIASMVPEGEDDYRLQIAAPGPLSKVVDTELSVRLKKAVAMSIAGLLLLAAGIIVWLRIPSHPVNKAEQVVRARLQKHHANLVDKLKNAPSSLQLADWAELGNALQTLLAEYAGLSPATSGGSHSSFLSQMTGRLSNNEIRQAEAILKGIEHLLASEHPDAEQRRNLLAQAENLLTDLAKRRPERQPETEVL